MAAFPGRLCPPFWRIPAVLVLPEQARGRLVFGVPPQEDPSSAPAGSVEADLFGFDNDPSDLRIDDNPIRRRLDERHSAFSRDH